MSNRNIVVGGGVNDVSYSMLVSSGTNDPKKKTPQPYTMDSFNWMRTRATRVTYGVHYDYPFLRSGVGSLPPPFTGNDENALQSKLSEAIKGHGFNASIAFAEVEKSISTIKRSALAVTRMMRGLMTGNAQMALRALGALPGQRVQSQVGAKLKRGDIPGALLAMRYGWEPLLSDAFAAYDALRVSSKNRSLTFKVRKTVKYEGEDSSAPTIYKLPCKGFRSVTLSVQMSEKLGFVQDYNVLDPAGVLWERIPFSYVVDWFIPIGQFLENASFFGSFTSQVVRSNYAYSAADTSRGTFWPDNVQSVVTAQDSWKGVRRTFVRTVSNGVSLSPPSLKTLKKAFSTTHLQNAAAIIAVAVESVLAPKASEAEKEARAREIEMQKAIRNANKDVRWKVGKR